MTPNDLRNRKPLVAACLDCNVELTPAQCVSPTCPTATHVCRNCGKLYDVNRDRVSKIEMNFQSLPQSHRGTR